MVNDVDVNISHRRRNDPNLSMDSTRDRKRRRIHDKVPPRSSLGQFSLGPTTQTTVVTTTTTTTTKFPPLILPGLHNAAELDPKQYPLATSPTPASLRDIEFSLGGQSIKFREASDTVAELEHMAEEENLLQRRNGVLRSVRNTPFLPPQTKQDSWLPSSPSSPSAQLLSGLGERPASPESISGQLTHPDVENTGNLPHPRRRRHGKERAVPSLLRSHPRVRAVQDSEPSTPETRSERTLTQQLRPLPHLSNIQNVLPSPVTEQHQLPSRRERSAFTEHDDDDEMRVGLQLDLTGPSRTVSRASYESVVPTPPIEPEDIEIQGQRLSPQALSSIPTRLHMSQSPSQHDGTLPSPSLSPVTAGINQQQNEYFADIDSNSDFSSTWALRRSHLEETPSHAHYESPAMTEDAYSEDEELERRQEAAPSLRDIPSMFTFFEALPDAMKSYVMHQLLRRCPKSTLHVVADVVNPVLKCDFLTLLPAELSLNILRYLDVQTLCRASQVSKKWRQTVNGAEGVWKELLDVDGYLLPDGELHQAVVQGWGWQDPAGSAGRELDMSQSPSIKTDSEFGSPGPSVRKKSVATTSLRRSKRKAATQLTNRGKLAKRQATSREASVDIEVGDWMAQMSTAEGPYNAANAAVLAVPHPDLSLPSLKGLHLYKSLYRRHHLIRRNWMTEESKPHHLAFRAHGSHVVTCLQFDTDKILTGSDDSNINVYDTKTGRLRKLLRGHEGGVWALQYMGNTLVSGSTDRSVRVWDIEAGLETHVFRGHTSTVRCLQILMPTKVGETAEGKDIMMPKQPLIITGSRDSTLRIWKLPKATDRNHIQAETEADPEDSPFFIRTLAGHQHSVRAIAAHADTLVSGSYDSTVRVWKISTGETLHRLVGHNQKVYSVVLDHARNRCISGSMDYMVKIWSLETGCALYTLEGHSSLVGLLDLAGDRLVSAAADSTLRIWDPENGQCKSTLTAHTGAITCFQHDAQKVISGSDRTLKLWDVKTGECKKDLLSELSGVWQVKFNDRRCVAAVQRGTSTFIEVSLTWYMYSADD